MTREEIRGIRDKLSDAYWIGRCYQEGTGTLDDDAAKMDKWTGELAALLSPTPVTEPYTKGRPFTLNFGEPATPVTDGVPEICKGCSTWAECGGSNQEDCSRTENRCTAEYACNFKVRVTPVTDGDGLVQHNNTTPLCYQVPDIKDIDSRIDAYLETFQNITLHITDDRAEGTVDEAKYLALLSASKKVYRDNIVKYIVNGLMLEPAAPTPTEPDGVTRGTGELIKDASEVTGIIPEGILKATETGLVELTRDDWIDTVGYVPRPDHDLRKVELKVAKKQLAADQQEIERLNVLLSQANDTAKFWAEYNSDGKWESRIAEAVKAERDWWESHHTGIKYGITDTIYIYKVTKKALEARMGKDKPDLGTARAV